MRISKQRNAYKAVTLDHTVVVEDATEEQYQQFLEFLKTNVPTTDRHTPKFKEPSFMEDEPTKMVFRFRHEDQAAAFKLMTS